MTQWWESLDLLLKALYCVAAFSSTILIIQTIQIFWGFGGDDFSSDGGEFPEDFDTDVMDGGNINDFDVLRLFSIQSVIAFLTVFSWMSILFIQSGTPDFLALIIGALFGLAAMYGVAKLIQLSAKLVSIGNMELKNALGQTGRVYIPIQANGSPPGKVIVTLQERQIEQDAITEGGKDLASGTPVRVVDIRGNILVVEKED